MRIIALTLALSFLIGCRVAVTPMTVHYDRCLEADYPHWECERDYYWVNQGYWYNGRWHRGRYLMKPGRRPRR